MVLVGSFIEILRGEWVIRRSDGESRNRRQNVFQKNHEVFFGELIGNMEKNLSL